MSKISIKNAFWLIVKRNSDYQIKPKLGLKDGIYTAFATFPNIDPARWTAQYHTKIHFSDNMS